MSVKNFSNQGIVFKLFIYFSCQTSNSLYYSSNFVHISKLRIPICSQTFSIQNVGYRSKLLVGSKIRMQNVELLFFVSTALNSQCCFKLNCFQGQLTAKLLLPVVTDQIMKKTLVVSLIFSNVSVFNFGWRIKLKP